MTKDAIKFTVQLIEEIKTAHQKAYVIFRKNIELADRSYYFNERALSVTLEFALLSLQAMNGIGIEDLLEDREDLKSLIVPVLQFNSLALECIISIERKLEKFKQSQLKSILDYSSFAKKYFSVIPLFFWWVASSSKDNCDVRLSLL